MIATQRFVFLHLHKSGGTFVNECLLRFVPGARQIGYHLPRTMIPRELAGLPVLGLVRSPWSYYLSWHSFQSARPRPNALYRILSEDGHLGFGGTLRNMLRLSEDADLLERVVSALPQAYGGSGINLPGFALAPIRGSGLGFYAFLHRYMFGEDRAVRVGRMEALREELPGMLEQAGEPVSAALREFIATAEPRNVSSHPRCADAYDDELRALVAERDAEVIERYGFSFED